MADTKVALGIVLMEDDDAVEGTSADLEAQRTDRGWLIMESTYWRQPFITAVANGGHSDALLAGASEAIQGTKEAVQRLDGRASLIIGNCGFMWAARDLVLGTTISATMLSTLDLLGVGLGMTKRAVGILTYSEPALSKLLRDHADRDRLRIVGLDDLPDWRAIRPPDYMSRGGWTFEGLGAQLTARLEDEFARSGRFEDVGVLLLECTALSNFRAAIRSATALPVLDIVSFASAALA